MIKFNVSEIIIRYECFPADKGVRMYLEFPIIPEQDFEESKPYLKQIQEAVKNAL